MAGDGDKVVILGLSLRASAKMFDLVDSGYAFRFSCEKLGGSCCQMHMFICFIGCRARLRKGLGHHMCSLDFVGCLQLRKPAFREMRNS